MRAGRVLGVVGLATLLVCGACRRPEEPASIDRETFIATYVDLRKAALASPTHTISDAERERVLSEHGVAEEDLVRFAEVRSVDPDYMVALWTEVSARVSPPVPPPSTGLPDTLTK
jgi:hypothetical protein